MVAENKKRENSKNKQTNKQTNKQMSIRQPKNNKKVM